MNQTVGSGNIEEVGRNFLKSGPLNGTRDPPALMVRFLRAAGRNCVQGLPASAGSGPGRAMAGEGLLALNSASGRQRLQGEFFFQVEKAERGPGPSTTISILLVEERSWRW